MKMAAFIRQSREAGTPAQLFGVLNEAAGSLGLPYLARLRPTASGVYRTADTTLPHNWLRRYRARDYRHIDPVRRYGPRHPLGLDWARLEKHHPLTPPQEDMLRDARDHGLKCGLTLPLYGPYGRIDLLSFAGPEDRALTPPVRNRLLLLGQQFHLCRLALGPAALSRAPLTRREADCLKWIARGKSSWEIGRILGISEHTVNGYIRDSYRKLNVSTRAMAVMAALRHGLITP